MLGRPKNSRRISNYNKECIVHVREKFSMRRERNALNRSSQTTHAQVTRLQGLSSSLCQRACQRPSELKGSRESAAQPPLWTKRKPKSRGVKCDTPCEPATRLLPWAQSLLSVTALWGLLPCIPSMGSQSRLRSRRLALPPECLAARLSAVRGWGAASCHGPLHPPAFMSSSQETSQPHTWNEMSCQVVAVLHTHRR